MKKYTTMKKWTIALLAISMTVTFFGCNDSTSDDNTSDNDTIATISQEDAKQELTFVYDMPADEEEDAQEDTEEKNESSTGATNDNTSVLSSTPSTGVAVTEYATVTDTNGEAVTNAAGEVQTEVVNVTEVVTVTDTAGNEVKDENGNVQTEYVPVTEPTEPSTATEVQTTTETKEVYKASYDTCKAYWLDMSQEGDFFFNGQFLVLEFQVNANTPDGSYPITISATDIASWDMIQWTPVCINGEVAVNQTAAAQDSAGEDFTLKINSVSSAKQGDIVTVTIDLSENPGFCGFVIDVQYDKNALTIVDTYAGDDFDAAIHYIS